MKIFTPLYYVFYAFFFNPTVNRIIKYLYLLDFKLGKSTFLANFDVSTPVAIFKSAFVGKLDKSDSTFFLPPKDFRS